MDRLRSFFAGLVLVLLGQPCLCQESVDVERFVKELGNPQFAVRDNATKKLLEYSGSSSRLALWLAGQKDPEVTNRLKAVIAKVKARNFEAFLAKSAKQPDGVPLDLYVEKVLANKQTLEQRHVPLVTEFIRLAFRKMDDRENRACIRWEELANRKVLAVDALKSAFSPRELTIGDDLAFTLLGGNLTISRNLRYFENASMHNAVAMVTDSFSVLKNVEPLAINASMIFCDGDLRTDSIDNSVVLCTGKISMTRRAGNSKLFDCTSQGPFPISLFSATSVGIEIEINGTGKVEVTSVDAKCSFDKRGVVRGDRLLSIDGKELPTKDDFRKALRKLVAEESILHIRIERHGAIISVDVDL